MTISARAVAAIDMPRPDGLPALVARAGQRLLDARNSAEVLEAKQIAEAALHYAKVTKAANDTHADCLRIITRAEMRMADEIDRKPSAQGQRRDLVQGLDEVAPSYEDLGIDKRRVSEWREVRDAGEDVVEAAISEALADGRAPTKADIRNHVRGTFGSGNNEWYTPLKYIDLAREVLGEIDLDPASNVEAQKDVQATQFYSADDDGLSHQWRGRVWLNPPYAQPLMSEFVAKMCAERRAGNVAAALMLTHNYTDTAWFQEAASVADAICFTRGRVKFRDADGQEAAPTQGQAFFYFGDDVSRFVGSFADVGFVVIPTSTKEV